MQNSHCSQVFRSIAEQNDIFEVVGYALPENERERLASRMNALNGYSELTLDQVLNDPSIEAVTIETDEIYLTKYALLAAKAGKHIHMEKPGGISLVDFEDLITVMKTTGKVFHIGYMYRYNPYIQELMAQIKNGDLGEIISVEAQMNCSHPVATRQWLENLPGGMMFFLGCHLIDLVLQIQGQPDRIIPYNKCSGVDGVAGEDFGMAVFEYQNGVSFVKTTAVELGGFERRQLVINGTKATVELKPLEWFLPDAKRLQTHRVVRNSRSWHQVYEKEISEPYDRYDPMMKSFAEYIRGEKKNPYSLDYELQLYKTVLKACEKEL
jgi:predicted dehydrogenase